MFASLHLWQDPSGFDAQFLGNCLPSICVTPNQRRSKKYVQWMSASPKAVFLAGAGPSTVLQCFPDPQQKPSKRARSVPTRRAEEDPELPLIGTVEQLQQQAEVNSDLPFEVGGASVGRNGAVPTTVDHSVWDVDPFRSQSVFQRCFEADMVLKGRVWILDQTAELVSVIWNATSAESFKILPSSFATTTFYFDFARHQSLGKCVDCPIFRTIAAEGGTPSCPHMVSRDSVLLAATSDEVSRSQFQLFLRRSFDETSPAKILAQTDSRIQVFVVCPAVRAAEGGLDTRHGVISIDMFPATQAVYVTCSNTHCRRRLNKRRSPHPKDFCPHFETLWKCAAVASVLRQNIQLQHWFKNESMDDEVDDLGSSGDVSEMSDNPPDNIHNDENIEGGTSTVEPWATSVRFDTMTGVWEPSGQGPFCAIPVEHTEFTRAWADRRARGDGLLRASDGSLVWVGGLLHGSAPCAPPAKCSSCQASAGTFLLAGHTLIRTYLGCVKRNRQSFQCGMVHWAFNKHVSF